MADKKLGFGGQWVEIFRAGTHLDSEGVKRALDAAFLERVVRNFNPEVQEVPITAGSPIHPPDDAPAFGLATQVRLDGDSLLAQFSDVDPELEDLVKTKKLVSRSASFYLDPPRLKHVHFLGVQPASVKSLKRIHFSEGTTVDVQVDTAITFSEGDTETMKDEDVKKTIRESVAEFFKPISDLLSGNRPATGSANFSEADVKRLMDEAVTKVETSFAEKITALETKNDELQKSVDGQIGSSKRAEVQTTVAQFVEKGILPPALKDRVANFMEALAGVPDKKIVVVEFAEDGKTEKSRSENTLLAEFSEFVAALPPYIHFGEQFKGLRAEGDASSLAGDPKQKEEMRQAMGLNKKKEDK